MHNFTPIEALIGGCMIGLAVVLLLALNGRIAGVSGILFGAVSLTRSALAERLWRMAFVAGLIGSGFFYQWLCGEPLVQREGFPVALLIAAGLLVGFGTRLGSGCTSGHGLCGVARFSRRSIIATSCFFVVGLLCATAVHGWLLGGAA